MGHRVVGVQFDSLAVGYLRFLVALEAVEKGAQVVVDHRVIGVQFDTFTVGHLRLIVSLEVDEQ